MKQTFINVLESTKTTNDRLIEYLKTNIHAESIVFLRERNSISFETRLSKVIIDRASEDSCQWVLTIINKNRGTEVNFGTPYLIFKYYPEYTVLNQHLLNSVA